MQNTTDMVYLASYVLGCTLNLILMLQVKKKKEKTIFKKKFFLFFRFCFMETKASKKLPRSKNPRKQIKNNISPKKAPKIFHFQKNRALVAKKPFCSTTF